MSADEGQTRRKHAHDDIERVSCPSQVSMRLLENRLPIPISGCVINQTPFWTMLLARRPQVTTNGRGNRPLTTILWGLNYSSRSLKGQSRRLFRTESRTSIFLCYPRIGPVRYVFLVPHGYSAVAGELKSSSQPPSADGSTQLPPGRGSHRDVSDPTGSRGFWPSRI